MNFIGIGSLELVIIMVVAFIFLGPERMIDAARLLGRLSREVRKMTADIRGMVDIDELTNPRPKGQAGASESQNNGPVPKPPDSPGNGSSDGNSTEADQTRADTNSLDESGGPVSFKSAREQHKEKMAEQAAQQDAPSPEERS